jgi:hypothetical protein
VIDLNSKILIERRNYIMAEQQPQEQVQPQQQLRCAIVIGMREDGSVFLETHGTEQNLITVEGLLGYGRRYVENEWKARQESLQNEAPQVVVPNEEVQTAPVVEPKPKRKTTRKKKEVEANA